MGEKDKEKVSSCAFHEVTKINFPCMSCSPIVHNVILCCIFMNEYNDDDNEVRQE